ncbi:MAG TPA: amidohydrolase family protein [Victivallales bacterium]|nr:amidohydrolase family protein [Victivallales bacterium]
MKIPLLKDHHSHPMLYTALQECLNISNIYCKKEALALFHNLNNEINIITGWYNNRYTFIPEDIETFRPIIILNISLHTLVLNKGAIEFLQEKNSELAYKYNDKIWIERNLFKLVKTIVAIACTKHSEQLNTFYDSQLNKNGIYHIEEMSCCGEFEIDAYKVSNLLPRTKLWIDPDDITKIHPDKFKYIHGVKLFTDGGTGSKTAAIKSKYISGGTGILNYKDKELRRLFEYISDLKLPLAVHSIGDLAIEQVINVLSESQLSIPIRLEHCTFISFEMAKKAKALNLTLSMQPNFSYMSVNYKDRLPKHYLEVLNPFRMLIDRLNFSPGKDLIFGSDGMPHGVNCAINASFFPPLVSQKLTIEEFIAGYCINDNKAGYVDIIIDSEQRNIKTAVTVN